MKNPKRNKRNRKTKLNHNTMTNGWSSLFAAIAVMAIIFLSLSIYFYSSTRHAPPAKKQGEPTEKSISNQAELQETPHNQSCPDMCAKANDICMDSCQDNNYFNLAVAAGDTSLCRQIKNDNERLNCQDSIIRKDAIASHDASSCDEMSSRAVAGECRNSVFRDEAFFRDDSTLCDKITDETMRANCHDTFIQQHAVEKKDLSLCEEIINDATRGRCAGTILLDMAAAENNASVCGQITDAMIRASCLDIFIQRTAIRQDNASLCRGMSSELAASSCRRIVLHEATPNMTENGENVAEKTGFTLDDCMDSCEKSNSQCEESCSDNKYLTSAMLKNDEAECDKIKDEAQQILCRDKIRLNNAVQERNTSLCSGMSSAGSKIDCQRQVLHEIAK